MAFAQLPDKDNLVDQQFVEIEGPDGLVTQYQYNAETNTLIKQGGRVIIPSSHGNTHIASDLVPVATTDSPGLMSANDKAKLDELLQMRVGVLGFTGAGFPDDGGFINGDLILAAGSEFISLERVGNIVRFTVDNPIPLNCGCFEPGCPVLMGDGTTKLIEDVKAGDEVITHTGDIRKVIKALSADYDGEIINVQTTGHNGKFAVTPGHPIYAYSEVINSKRTTAIRDQFGLTMDPSDETWIHSQNISKNDFLVKRHAHNIVNDADEVIWSEYFVDSSIIKDGKVYPARTSSKGNLFADGMAKGIPTKSTVDNDLMKLFGFYIAEGCYSDKNGIRFTVHTDELKSGYIGSEIIRIVRDKFGIECKIQNKSSCKNTVDIQFFSRVLGSIFKNWFGDAANKKKIPDWILELPSEKQYNLLLGILTGDASKRFTNKGTIRLEVASEGLTSQVRFISERAGLESRSFAKRRTNSKDKYDNIEFTATHNRDLFYDLTGVMPEEPQIFNYLKTDNETLHKVRDITKTHHKGKVYNFEIENDHSYVVDGIVVHNCEECAQIFWVQDETDTVAIRPPSCNGKLPGTNVYGEMKIYLMPESTLVDPANPAAVLNTKGNFPTFIFKRYDDGIVSGQAELDIVLARRSGGTTSVGWSMTPGPTGIAECVWFMGDDDDGNEIRFELELKEEPGMLGALLYKGHTLTRRPAVVTNYDANILDNNQYLVKYWNVLDAAVIPDIDEFTATNIWRYENPESTTTAVVDPKALVLDATQDLLSIGTLVQLWEFQIGEQNNTRILRRFFIKEPNVNVGNIWSHSGAITFGDTFTARDEIAIGLSGTNLGTDEDAALEDISDSRILERSIWGITGFDDPLFLANDGDDGPTNETTAVTTGHQPSEITYDSEADITTLLLTAGDVLPLHWYKGFTLELSEGGSITDRFKIYDNGDQTIMICGDITGTAYDATPLSIIREGTMEPSAVAINDQYVADIDPSIPGLKVTESNPTDDAERPVFVWHRINHGNLYMKALIGQADTSEYPPYDILLRAPIDKIDDLHVKIIRRGRFTTGPFIDQYYVVAKGVHWKDFPDQGDLRVLNTTQSGQNWRFVSKAAFWGPDDDATLLIGNDEDEFPFPDDLTTAGGGACPGTTLVAKVLHQDYTSPCLRVEFSINQTSGNEQVQMQFKAGMLDMSEVYELNEGEADDNLVRGLRPGFAISQIYTQNGFIFNAETPSAIPEDFRVVTGGFTTAAVEPRVQAWNTLEVMYRNSQLWVWWNGLLIPPDTTASAALPSPVAVTTPYFPLTSDIEWGKIGLRLWPGSVVRQIQVRDQNAAFSEFQYGQVTLET